MGGGHPTGATGGCLGTLWPFPERGILFLKASTSCVLGDHKGHFIIDHSHYYCYYITIFIKLPPTDEWGTK